MELTKTTMASDIRTNFFSNRVVNKWNGLKQETVSANNIESFKEAYDGTTERGEHENEAVQRATVAHNCWTPLIIHECNLLLVKNVGQMKTAHQRRCKILLPIHSPNPIASLPAGLVASGSQPHLPP